ncbi:hypothetical protein ACFYY8_16625 [Streptosporangium sp. NPDC001559]|uniref:hypothetical protein n=1 Tax=Streptosporangium sp. NPDC001559 TaxID=3366187 RepID=UPI0036EF1C68
MRTWVLEGSNRMVLGAVQWIALGAGCLNVALGVYALATNRLPRVPFLHRGFLPRRYGWGQLMMSLFVFVVALEPAMMEWPYELLIAVLMFGFGACLAGMWTMCSGKRARQTP